MNTLPTNLNELDEDDRHYISTSIDGPPTEDDYDPKDLYDSLKVERERVDIDIDGKTYNAYFSYDKETNKIRRVIALMDFDTGELIGREVNEVRELIQKNLGNMENHSPA